jgi:hypothetical protein
MNLLQQWEMSSRLRSMLPLYIRGYSFSEQLVKPESTSIYRGAISYFEHISVGKLIKLNLLLLSEEI